MIFQKVPTVKEQQNKTDIHANGDLKNVTHYLAHGFIMVCFCPQHPDRRFHNFRASLS